ncbi:hemerythrin domain-containing protein [Massilia sp. 9I]|uniref:hemerythrin domain-containing protein n=1 Tax=Massilia sp. 9I TaxID=2653152 RepID=UPI0012F42A59|nr:hemerythrin domain-containing protein [Massilia sp. 9I]VXB01423.1 Hemerythrin HHE cation binding domain containing protein [Massilia sp. 9I]
MPAHEAPALEPPGGILAQLRAEHARMRGMFHAFAMLDREEEAQRERAVDDLCDALALHALLEDELFYPALRGAVDDSLLEDAALEHDSMRELVEQLESLFPDDDYFDVSVAVLAEEVERHVAFEENLLFPALAQAGADQLALGLRLHARRAEIESDLAALPPAIDGCEPRGMLRGAHGALRERRSRAR